MAFNLTLRKSFLYIFATVGLVISIFGAISLINLGLKTYVFTKADNYCYNNYAVPAKDGGVTMPTQAELDNQKKQCEDQQAASKQGQASNAIASLIVGAPLFLYTWNLIRKENLV